MKTTTLLWKRGRRISKLLRKRRLIGVGLFFAVRGGFALGCEYALFRIDD